MTFQASSLVTLNVGSSSLKYALYPMAGALKASISGTVDGVEEREKWLDMVLEKIGNATPGESLAFGHRIVHGGAHFSEPQRLDDRVMSELKRLVPFAPEHLPNEIALIEQITKRYPKAEQILCFDTAFHHDLPRVARLLPIPLRYEAEGIRRYGFHGLSYEFLRSELIRLNEPAIRKGRVILAHLGNGASLAALLDGCCIDTTMGFTPAGGVVMGSRSGDLDPGVLTFIAQNEHLGPRKLSHLFNHESGMIGLSEVTSDMKRLVELEKSDVRAADAVSIFCQQIKKAIGSFAAVLGGLDVLVFAGGIGEHDASLRARICDGLLFAGVELDEIRNLQHAGVISSDSSRVSVRVIATDEEIVIARATKALLSGTGSKK